MPSARPRRPWLGPVLCLGMLVACERSDPPAPPRADRAPIGSTAGAPRPVSTELPDALRGKPAASAPLAAAPARQAWSVRPSVPADYAGAWFAVTSLGAGAYAEPSFEAKKVGYLKNGGRVPVETEPVSKKTCTGGWYRIRSGGFICGNLGTTDLTQSGVKFGGAQPKLEDVLPYTYARNAKHGTPLYKSVPSREQMERYEPYLLEKASDAKGEDAKRKTNAKAGGTKLASDTVSSATRVAPTSGAEPSAAQNGELGAAIADGGLVTPSEGAPEKPWWQRENIKDNLHEVKLEELEAEADEILAKRMVTGFYVAVDKAFRWNGRAWYKTTRGLVTPSERFWQTAGPKFVGVELDGADWKLPVAWVYGGRNKTGTYAIDLEQKKVENAKSVDKFTALALTGESQELGGTRYERLQDGGWIKRAHVRITNPGAPPEDLGPDERWIDVNLATQTLVAFVGTRPIYATMISSGKESKIKEKDHRTPTGSWRIRDKHLTTTMDGDGSAAGDLPYSIEDVPYAMYFHKAFALHGAFWHNNFGVQMSHGCVNLSPLDAKYLFFFAQPTLPAGFHGVFAAEEGAGTRIVIHE